MNRRRFLAAGSIALGFAASRSRAADTKLSPLTKSLLSTTEKQTPRELITTFNNFYEFGTQKDQPAKNSTRFQTRPWTVSIEGEVSKPQTLDIDAVLKIAPLEERIYRHRCVEGWSIVVPWIGYSLSTLLKLAEPTSKAKFVAFQSYHDPKQMPLATSSRAGIDFPYVEGLRIDEAMHPLALLCAGLYGDVLPSQNGAPLRLVLPWKYGFKSVKSIVKIRLVTKEPATTWVRAYGRAYGFYANVNPSVDHPDHSQAKEQRLGVDLGKRTSTRLFNGYDQVADLYRGMDLRKFH